MSFVQEQHEFSKLNKQPAIRIVKILQTSASRIFLLKYTNELIDSRIYGCKNVKLLRSKQTKGRHKRKVPYEKGT